MIVALSGEAFVEVCAMRAFGRVNIEFVEPEMGDRSRDMTPSEARELARALIAAADGCEARNGTVGL